MADLLHIDSLSKSFGSLLVIDSFNMHLKEGEALGIIGPNGAGKSTLFNLITGSLSPNSGSIQFDGTDITSVPAHNRCRAGIGRSYQIPHPFVVDTINLFKNEPLNEKEKIHFIHLNHTNPLLNENSIEYQNLLNDSFKISYKNDQIIL